MDAAQLRRKKTGILAPTCYVFNVCALRLAPFCAISLRHQEAQSARRRILNTLNT